MSSSLGRSPTLWSRFRQMIGRALRETGQALDRVGIRGEEHALRPRRIGDNPCKFDDHLSRHRHQFPLLLRGEPKVSPHAAFLAPCSTLIGTVVVGPDSSVWYGAILRGDACENGRVFGNDKEAEPWDLNVDEFELERDGRPIGGGVYIGTGSNIQDGAILTARKAHCKIGDGVTIGHLAQLHSATVGNHCLIGMSSVVNEKAVIEEESLVGAGSVVPAHAVVNSGELWVGNPARKLRDLSMEERQGLRRQASEYVKVASGQQDVMELGGNMPDNLVRHVMLEITTRSNEMENSDQQEPSQRPNSDVEAVASKADSESDQGREESKVANHMARNAAA